MNRPAKLQKNNAEECIFDYMASHIECRVNKNSLLQCCFLAILSCDWCLICIHWHRHINCLHCSTFCSFSISWCGTISVKEVVPCTVEYAKHQINITNLNIRLKRYRPMHFMRRKLCSEEHSDNFFIS